MVNLYEHFETSYSYYFISNQKNKSILVLKIFVCYTVSYKAILLCLRCTEVSRHLGWAKLAVGGSEYHAHATGFEWMTQGCERKQRINCVLQHLLYYTPILTAIYNMTRFSI